MENKILVSISSTSLQYNLSLVIALAIIFLTRIVHNLKADQAPSNISAVTVAVARTSDPCDSYALTSIAAEEVINETRFCKKVHDTDAARTPVNIPASTMAPAKVHQSPAVVGELIAETGFYQSMTLVSPKPIVSKHSQYQRIELVEAVHYGKVLLLDGVVQLTERDANSYNEMMAHIPLFQHEKPMRVLVIGGGDGYVLSEVSSVVHKRCIRCMHGGKSYFDSLSVPSTAIFYHLTQVLKHPSVEFVDHIDLDEEVIEICKEHFPWGPAWADPRVKLHIANGSLFVANSPSNYYDVIIQDSSDPHTWNDDGSVRTLPSEVLYTQNHFQNIHRILKPGGLFNFQAEAFQIPGDLDGISEWRRLALNVGFADARYGTLSVSSYATGQIGFLLCSKSDVDGNLRLPSMDDVKNRYVEMVEKGHLTTFYQPKLQFSSFDLPLWVEESIYDHSDILSGVAGRNEF